jgi:flagellin-specific chaperone FliS
MIEQYNIFENLQKAKKYLRDNNIPETDSRFTQLREIFKNNLGYIGPFTVWMYRDRENLDKIEDVYKKLKSINNLDRDISSFEKMEDLYDYLQDFEINRKVNQVIKSLPSRTRKLANDKLRNLIKLNADDKTIKALKDFYSKKGGRYDNVESLIKDTKDFINNLKGDFNSESIKNKIKEKDLNVDIIIDTPELLMIRVNDYEASCAIGSKHWCISTSQSMWNQYKTPFTNQYFIFDFTKDISDKKHMIGTTISPGTTTSPGGKISSAHWADDTYISDLSVLDNL